MQGASSPPPLPLLGPPAGAEPSLSKGMSFPDSKAAFYAVQDYALFHNKRVKVARRGGKHRRMVCTSSAPCPFFVQLYLHNSKTDHTWYVSSAELRHSPVCTARAKPTQRQIVASASFQRALASSPNGTAAQLLQQVQGQTNLRTIYRAKQSMKRDLLNHLGAAYRKIPSLLRSFLALNPGSFSQYDVGGPESAAPGAFARAFAACGVFTASTALNQQIYGFEYVPCSNREADYEGTQLFLLGKDGNMRNVIIAAACCDAPSRDNFRWFFRCVEASGVNLRYCPVLCAIDPELLGLEAELGLTFRYCTRYIIERELAQLGAFNRHHHALVWGLQSSESEEEYANRLEWIGTTCGPGVENYLRQFPMERWVVAGNLGKVALYGWRSRTFFESMEQEQQDGSAMGQSLGLGSSSGGSSMATSGVNLAAAAVAPSSEDNTVKSATTGGTESPRATARGVDRFRNLLPFAFLEALMLSYMQDAYERSMLAGQWKQQGRKVTQRAQELYDAQCRRIGEYKVSRASETVAFVTQINKSPSLRRRVDLQASTCTCAFIDQYAIPCRHLIAVLLFCDQMDSVCDRFAPGYLVDNYALAFRGKAVELPLDSALSEDPTCARPVSASSSRRARATGTADGVANGADKAASATPRRRNKRPASTTDAGGEALDADAVAPPAPQRLRLCKKCRGPGHNMRSCSYEPPAEAQPGV
ncbi:hypothetical protein BBJ28_00016581 [Nothophytophthora sp. Chile5]|nr:hypothetical protein BBJ28_00016581 [Nothophytophthora sp. Chile5]